jgi:hypothetical protein
MNKIIVYHTKQDLSKVCKFGSTFENQIMETMNDIKKLKKKKTHVVISDIVKSI